LSHSRRPRTPTLFPYTTLFRSQLLVGFVLPGRRSGGFSRRSGCFALGCRGSGRTFVQGAQHFGTEYCLAFALDDVAQHTVKGERAEEHTSELQSRENLVCRLLL